MAIAWRAYIPSSTIGEYINYGKLMTGGTMINTSIGNIVTRTPGELERSFYIHKEGDTYIMYVFNHKLKTQWDYEFIHKSGYTETITTHSFGTPNGGDGLIYKYTSEDGINWTLVGSGKVYANGSEVYYEEFYGSYLEKACPVVVFIGKPVLTYEEA